MGVNVRVRGCDGCIDSGSACAQQRKSGDDDDDEACDRERGSKKRWKRGVCGGESVANAIGGWALSNQRLASCDWLPGLVSRAHAVWLKSILVHFEAVIDLRKTVREGWG